MVMYTGADGSNSGVQRPFVMLYFMLDTRSYVVFGCQVTLAI
jgi:hypothetical protein